MTIEQEGGTACDNHHLRHRELRHDEEGSRVADRARRDVSFPRLQEGRHRSEAAGRLVREGWAKDVGWETLLNRAGTTFRRLPDADKAKLDQPKAIALMFEQPSMIKRPVLDVGGRLLVGFKVDAYESACAGGAARPRSSTARSAT